MLRRRVQGMSCLLVAILGTVAIAQPDKAPPAREIRANGVDLSYVEQGRGTPVVFVHGAVSDHRFWEPQRAVFAKPYRFVTYSFRYHGKAPWPDDGKQYSPDTHAADLLAFVSALKGGPVHLVGLSYGGLLATMAAVKRPEAFLTLTLAEPALSSVLAEKPEGKPIIDQWNKGAEPMIAALKAGDNVAAVRLLSGLVTGRSEGGFEAFPAPFREILLDNARTMPLLMASPPANVTCEMLRRIKIPTLFVRGERTPQFFAKINVEAGPCIAGSEQAVISNASHAMSYDNPAEFNRVVLAFLSRTSSVRR